MPQPKSSLTLCTVSDSGDARMYLSAPELIEDDGGDWRFAAYESKDVWLATFVYPCQNAATRAREAMALALRDCTSITTTES